MEAPPRFWSGGIFAWVPYSRPRAEWPLFPYYNRTGMDTKKLNTVVVKACFKYNEYLYCKVEHTVGV
jgi:hypothetical protein